MTNSPLKAEVGVTRRQFIASAAATALATSAEKHARGLSSAEQNEGGSEVKVLLLSGSDWFIRKASLSEAGEKPLEPGVVDGDWVQACVPGNIQADLERAHLLSPLWYGLGDPRLADVARKDWWYRKDFRIPDGRLGEFATIVFDGVDHQCEVWVNGKLLGKHEGMYKRFWFDVSELLLKDRPNRLEVKIARMPESLDAVFASSDVPGGGEVIKAANAVRQCLKDLKSPANCAWDWAFAVWTLGIWKDVRLELTGPARIEWVRVQTQLSESYTSAKVKATLEISSRESRRVRGVFRITGPGTSVERFVEATLEKGPNEIAAQIPVEHAALWWPNGQGEQPMYTLQASLVDPETGALSDRRTTRFALREIVWEQAPGAPADFPNPLKLVMNGRQIRQMGSNLLPPDLLFGRIDHRGDRLIEQVHAAGMNMLRVWAAGVILPESTYDRADDLGIMLMQGFALANCTPETDSVFLGNLEATVTSIVKQLRNHPCIVEWSGGNEMDWQQGTDHPALRLMERVVRQCDGRMLRATEPAQGSARHGTYTYVYENEPEPYLTWLGAGKEKNLYEVYDGFNAMRLSEFGTNSPAHLEVWHQTIPPRSQWPLDNWNDPVLIRKNVFWGAVLPQNWLHKEITESLFGPLDSLESLVRAGQFLGAEGLRYAIDSLRRAGPEIAGGFMSWDLNEPWPNGAGSYMIDFYGRPLMNYFFAAQALAPISLNLKYDNLLFDQTNGLRAEVWIVSDAPVPASGLKWKWLARDHRGRVFGTGEGGASVNPIESLKVGEISVKPPAATGFGPVFVEMQLTDSSGRVLIERIHAFGAKGRPATLAGLLQNKEDDRDDVGDELQNQPVSRTRLDVSVSSVQTRGNHDELEMRITNMGTMTALFCEPHPLIEYRTDLEIANCCLCVPPGESRRLLVRAPAAADRLSLAETGWRISCWNAPDVVIVPSADVLLSLGRKDAMCREYFGYGDAIKPVAKNPLLQGRRPDPNGVPYQLAPKSPLRFSFTIDPERSQQPARLRINSADQSREVKPVLRVEVNGWTRELDMPAGLGSQNIEPCRLAFPATAQMMIPAQVFKAGSNLLTVEIVNEGWITWDSLDLVAEKRGG